MKYIRKKQFLSLSNAPLQGNTVISKTSVALIISKNDHKQIIKSCFASSMLHLIKANHIKVFYSERQVEKWSLQAQQR